MGIDVTGRIESFAELSAKLEANKFGILDSEGDWSYLECMEAGGFAFSNGVPGYPEPLLPHFPEQTHESPATIQSKKVWMDTGKVEILPVIKVLAYDD